MKGRNKTGKILIKKKKGIIKKTKTGRKKSGKDQWEGECNKQKVNGKQMERQIKTRRSGVFTFYFLPNIHFGASRPGSDSPAP
jgi:hypothetical protein